MGLEKALLKSLIYADLGSDCDREREAALGRFNQHHGARRTAFSLAKEIDKQIVGAINQDVADEALDEETAAIVRRWIARAAGLAEHFGHQAEKDLLLAQGQIMAIEAFAKSFSRMEADEQKKVEQGDDAEGHPGPSLKEIRNSEEAEVAPDDE